MFLCETEELIKALKEDKLISVFKRKRKAATAGFRSDDTSKQASS